MNFFVFEVEARFFRSVCEVSVSVVDFAVFSVLGGWILSVDMTFHFVVLVRNELCEIL